MRWAVCDAKTDDIGAGMGLPGNWVLQVWGRDQGLTEIL